KGPAHWCTVPLSGGALQRHEIPVPPDTRQFYCVTSPRGERLVWVAVSDRPLTPLQRLLTGLGPGGDGAQVALSVTDSQGKKPERSRPHRLPRGVGGHRRRAALIYPLDSRRQEGMIHLQ